MTRLELSFQSTVHYRLFSILDLMPGLDGRCESIVFTSEFLVVFVRERHGVGEKRRGEEKKGGCAQLGRSRCELYTISASGLSCSYLSMHSGEIPSPSGKSGTWGTRTIIPRLARSVTDYHPKIDDQVRGVICFYGVEPANCHKIASCQSGT